MLTDLDKAYGQIKRGIISMHFLDVDLTKFSGPRLDKERMRSPWVRSAQHRYRRPHPILSFFVYIFKISDIGFLSFSHH